MLKKMLVLILSALLVFSAAGCGNQAPGKTDPAPSDHLTDPVPAETTAPESSIDVVDESGVVIGSLDGRGSFTAADAGIFYCVFDLKEYQFTGQAEYHFFRLEDRKDILLGSLQDQCYETIYDRTELDGIVYTLAVTGNPNDDDADTLWLLAFDPMRETMTQYSVTDYGFPYAALTAANGKLWIMNHEMDAQKADKIYEFDPQTKAVREVLSYDGSVEGQGSLRSVYADENVLYVLKLQNSGDGNELFLESYDLEYRKISERGLGELMIPFALNVHGIMNEEEARNQFGIMVSGFAVKDGRFLYYENFSILRLVIDLETGTPLLAQDDVYSISGGGGQPAIYRLIFSEEEADLSVILCLKDGILENTELTVPDGPSLLLNLTRSLSGSWLLLMHDGQPGELRKTVLCCLPSEN